MKKLIALLFLFSISINLIAQPLNDPFAPSVAAPIETISVNEQLPSFTEFIKNSSSTKAQIKIKSIAVNTLLRTNTKLVLLDVRTEEEYKVSHIKDSRLSPFNTFSLRQIWMLNKENLIIVYSTKAERSRLVTQYMKEAGFMDVRSLEGGLIDWKNSGYTIVDSQEKETEKVHVHKKLNAKQLKNGKAIW